MGKILVIDDTEFWRNIVSELLRKKGHHVSLATNGLEALNMLRHESVDLIILDVEMPQIHGLSFLQQIRIDEHLRNVPVIMLTGDMLKEHILQAKALGVVDYLLKARFSPPELMDRVNRRLATHGSPAIPPSPPPAARPAAAPGDIPRLLDREESLARAEAAMAGRTMSGVIEQVIAAASSPLTALSDLAALIGHDPVLTARILQAANSVSNITAHGTIATLPDAVRVIGCTAVRNIAASIGVFDAMPPPEGDGFHPIRCWQHSIGVATICDKLAPAGSGELAHLIGLCHDLGEILFRSHFGTEYRQVLEFQESSGKPLIEVQRKMLGISHAELAERILQRLGLPQCICRPITLFHESTRTRTAPTDPLARTLQLADAYATGMFLAASEFDMVRPFTRTECRNATGMTDPPRPDDGLIRYEIFAMTALYAKLSHGDLGNIIEPVYPRVDARIFVARDPSLSTFDPVTAALESLADLTIGQSLPSHAELADYDGLVVLARTNSTAGFTASDLANAAGSHVPTLWLTGAHDKPEPSNPDQPTPPHWPIALSELAMFVQRLSPAALTAHGAGAV
jgi:CheY-like chemotaxis protein